MSKARLDGLCLLLLGIVIFVTVGFTLENTTLVSNLDFRVVYYSTRCLLNHGDPYQAIELQRTYHVEGGESPYDTAGSRRVETQYLYPPHGVSVFRPLRSSFLWARTFAVARSYSFECNNSLFSYVEYWCRVRASTHGRPGLSGSREQRIVPCPW
jgi:hypothetical protein